MTRLSRLCILDLPSTVAILRVDHLIEQDLGQERNHAPRQSAGTSKKPDHDRITQHKPERKWGALKKICEEKYSGEHKTQREFYEGAAHRVRQKIPITHRVKTGYEGSQ
jgi:hypothetical protein